MHIGESMQRVLAYLVGRRAQKVEVEQDKGVVFVYFACTPTSSLEDPACNRARPRPAGHFSSIA